MIGGSWRTRTASLLERGVLAITPNSLNKKGALSSQTVHLV